MIHFVGAGPGAEDLITVRGQRYLEQADVVIYAGSLVNPGLLKSTKETCEIYNSAKRCCGSDHSTGAEAFEGSRYSGVCRFTGKSGAS